MKAQGPRRGTLPPLPPEKRSRLSHYAEAREEKKPQQPLPEWDAGALSDALERDARRYDQPLDGEG